MVTAWRIVKRKHAKHAFTGDGARIFGGRWNNTGTLLVYAAGSQSLAALEMLVRIEESDLLAAYVLFAVAIEPALITDLDIARLQRNWKRDPAPPSVKSMGDEWVASGNSAALRVPSAIIPAEHNFLLNPLHWDFSRFKISPPAAFRFDFRLVKTRFKQE